MRRGWLKKAGPRMWRGDLVRIRVETALGRLRVEPDGRLTYEPYSSVFETLEIDGPHMLRCRSQRLASTDAVRRPERHVTLRLVTAGDI